VPETIPPEPTSSLDQELMRLVRREYPDGPDDSEFWEAVSRAIDVEVSDELRVRAVAHAKDALAVARGELTLGAYLSRLRGNLKTSLSLLSQQASLSPTLIVELEHDAWPVNSIQANRLARLAVLLGAAKAVLMDLVGTSLSGRLSNVSQARLTRLDSKGSRLSAERAARRTASRPTIDPSAYLLDLSTAFDDESSETLPP
jgi:hypothetical protein